MSRKEYRKVYEKMYDFQKDAMGELFDAGTNHDGHVWVTLEDAENAVAKILQFQQPARTPMWEGRYVCRNCGSDLDGELNGCEFRADFCPMCGYEIDWGENKK